MANKSSRDEVLRALRAANVPPAALPEVRIAGVQYPDARAQFANSVSAVGGRCVFAESTDIEVELSRLPEYVSANRVLSLVDGVKKANVELGRVRGAPELADVDFCVLPGEFGVAENGAVW